MSKAIGIFVVLSFFALAVFGFLALGHHEDGKGWENCMAALTGGGFCMENNAFSLALFHINFLKSFSRAVIPLLALAFFLLVILVFRAAALSEFHFGDELRGKASFVSFFGKPLPPPLYRFLDWSSVLRENI